MLEKTALPTKRETAVPTLRAPWPIFENMWTDFERFLDRPLSSKFPFLRHEGDKELWMPRVDVFRKGTDMIVKADLPGLKKEEVKVTLEEGNLVLQGERKEEKEIKNEDFYRCERTYGSFYRRLNLGFEADPAKVEAKFTDGVLEVKVPMPAQAALPKKEIPVH